MRGAGPHPTETLPALLARDGFRSPDIFVQQIDPAMRTAIVLRMTRAAYATASFLDARVLPLVSEGFEMPHDDLVGRTRAISEPARPLQFIFHASHVGSTLLSRLVEEAAGGVLSLREPPTLRTLAKCHDALSQPSPPLSASEFELWLATQVRLWARGYADTRCVVVKATSTTQRIGPALLEAASGSKAILLNLRAEPYIVALLGGSLNDINANAQKRMQRLGRMLEGLEAGAALTIGETAAMSWLTERLTQQRLSGAFPGRTLSVDFDSLLNEPRPRLAAVLGHLGLAALDGFENSAAYQRLMTRHAKAPGTAYSASDRTERMAQSRRANAQEIRRGLAWLERVARSYPEVAAAMSA